MVPANVAPGVNVMVFLSSAPIHLLFVAGTTYFLLLSVSNIVWLRLSFREPKTTNGRRVSVLVPARDEEENIARCLDSLLNQTYENYEIVVLDDRSTDRTWDIVCEYRQRHPDLIRAVKGEPLPPSGWTGKAHAMQQLSAHAEGDYLLFTDADTVHSRRSVSWAVTNIERHRVDFVSGFVYQELETLGERVIVPATYIMTAMILPLWLIPATKSPAFSFAIGQLIMFRRSAFDAIRGYESISARISDDVFMARRMKEAGFRTIFLDVRRYVRCRMYDGYASARAGMSKNIYDFFKHRPVFLALALTVLIVFALLPLYLLTLRLLTGSAPIPHTEASIVLFMLAWTLTLYDRGAQWWIPLLYPLLFLSLLSMAWTNFGRVALGRGVVWKGRTIR